MNDLQPAGIHDRYAVCASSEQSLRVPTGSHTIWVYRETAKRTRPGVTKLHRNHPEIALAKISVTWLLA